MRKSAQYHRNTSARSQRTGNLLSRLTLFAILLSLACGPAHAQWYQALNPFSSDEDPNDEIRNPHWFSTRVIMPVNDEDLVNLVENRSLLFTTTETPVAGPIGLLNHARADFENLVGILYSQAYYGGLVDITLDGKPLTEYRPVDTFESHSEDDRVEVVVRIQPKQPFTLGKISISADPLQIFAADYGLVSGMPAKSDDIFAAETALIDDLKAAGYPLAELTNQNIVADHDTNTLDISVTVDSGGQASYGDVSITGTEDMETDFTRFMLDLEPGQQYDPEEVKRGMRRLRNLDVFSSAVIENAETLTTTGQLPMKLTVTERSPRIIGAGATLSSIDGVGLESYWTHRNLFGEAERLELNAGVDRLGKEDGFENLNAEFGIKYTQPGFLAPDAKLVSSLNAEQEIDDGLRNQLVTSSNQVEYIFDENRSLLSGLSVEYSKDRREGDTTDYFITSLPTEIRFDYRDDPLNPTSGFQAIAELEPGYEINNSEFFLKAEAELSAYQGLDDKDRWIIAARTALGSYVTGGDSLPSNRRFYAGGGGSVRGYGYRRIGPKNEVNDAIGGSSLVEGSLEIRHHITENIQIVPFVDFGAVSRAKTLEFDDLQYGAGLGARYLTPIGPLRFDVAVPLNREESEDEFGIYVGIGQAF